MALIGSGLFVCCAPITTQVLSKMFSEAQGSVFTHEELVAAAVATRDYTVGAHDKEALFYTLYDINMKAKNEGRDRLSGAPDLPRSVTPPSIDELSARLSFANDSYVLTHDALSHLDDVFAVVSAARVIIALLAVLGLVGCIIIGISLGRKSLGVTLIAAAIMVGAVFVALAIWATLDFPRFFAVLHALFFAEGTWSFSVDSLLIRMYPTQFWVGMGVIWLTTSVLACIICFIIGRTIKGRKLAS
ncbi:MAG: DUF1461 domain-containing protein [Eggerthellaceae bacterium]|nr:DUF1461 domain-containing protein [Eggerthellaceae bacterium]MDR2721334.1 DUF1461 domain-containing protein [Coriobacteriaceae bacterium]